MTGSTIQRFSRNFWALTVSNILYRLVSVGVAMYLGRALGAAVLGQYATVMNVLTLFLSFSDLGVTNFIIKEVSKQRSLTAEYLNNFFALQVFTGIAVVLSILLTGVLSGYPPLLMLALAIGCLGPFFSGLSNAYNALLNAHEVIWPFAVIEMICMLVFLAGNIIVVLLHEGLIALIVVTVVVSAVKYLLGRQWSKRFDLRVRWQMDQRTVTRLLVMGFPFLIINGAHYAIQRLDVLFLSWVDSDAHIGMYAASSRLIFASLFFINAAGTAVYPVLSRLLIEDQQSARSVFRRSNTALVISANYTALIFFFLAPGIISLLYGPGYDGSVAVLRILAWFIPLFAYGILSNNLLMVGSGVGRAAAASIAGLSAMLICEPLLIAR
jgi:O-antigen/teichoic acid export membrane protein